MNKFRLSTFVFIAKKFKNYYPSNSYNKTIKFNNNNNSIILYKNNKSIILYKN